MIAEATAQIGSKEYTAHGLRKNAAKALAEAGCTVHQIMAITGHRTWKQAMHYTQGAAQKEPLSKPSTNSKARPKWQTQEPSQNPKWQILLKTRGKRRSR